MTKRNTGVLWSVTQSLNADEKKQAQDNMGLDTLYSGANTDSAEKYVKRVYRDSNGKIVTVQSDTNSSFNYNDPSSAPINGVGVKAAIDSITVKVDDDTAALNRLMVTSKSEDAIFGADFYSGLKKVSPAGHTEYSYVSVNCGEGLYISDGRYNEPGKLCLSEASASTYGGIKIGYSSDGDNYAVQLDPTSKKAYVNVPTSTLVNEVTCSHDSVGNLRTDPDRTITYLHQATNGQLSATFSDISIDFSKVHPESSSSYVAGEFVNLVTDDGGKLVPARIVAASKTSSAPSRTSGPITGDKIMFCFPNGNSPEYWYSSTSTLSFNTSNTGKCLTQAGTWADFNNYSLPLAANGTRGGIQIGYSESNSGSATNRNYALKLSSEKAYVNVPWSDTKNTVGVGSTNPSANEVFVFPFVRSNSGTSQQSYTQLSAVNLLSVSETTDAMDYMLIFNGWTIPKVNISGAVDDALLTYNILSGQLIKAGSCGNSTTPIYLNSNGCPTACSIVQPFALNRSANNNYGDQLQLSSTDNTYGAAVKVRKDSGETPIFWPGSSTPQDPTIGYLAPRIGSSDGGKFLGVNNSDNTVRWLSVPPSTVIGEEATIPTGHIWVPHEYNGIIFGDGFEFTPNLDNYNCYGISSSMGVMEGMSITYALTALTSNTQSGGCEFFNKNRLLNPSGTGHYYDTAQLYRTATTGTSTSTSYVACSTIPSGNQMDLAVVPPHHFLLMHVMIHWKLDTGGSAFSDNNVWISISLQDSAGTNASPGSGNSRCLVDTYERGVSSDNCGLYRPNYTFIAYNNSDQNKYIHYYQGAASQLGGEVYKQMILFKAPGYGATDQPNMEST